MDLTLYDDTYDAFCNAVKKEAAQILEVGCGPGNITKYLLTKQPNYNILATDVAPAMIALAQKNNPSAKHLVLDARDLKKIDKKFDGIVCGFCLPYIAKEDVELLISDCKELLHNEGVLYLSAIQGEYANSGYEMGSSGNKTYVYYYSLSLLKEILQMNNFKVQDLFQINYTKADKSIQTHLVLLAKKK